MSLTIAKDITEQWIRGHYHCKQCGGELEFWKALGHRSPEGVTRIGGCKKCWLLFIEHEYTDPTWVKIT